MFTPPCVTGDTGNGGDKNDTDSSGGGELVEDVLRGLESRSTESAKEVQLTPPPSPSPPIPKLKLRKGKGKKNWSAEKKGKEKTNLWKRDYPLKAVLAQIITVIEKERIPLSILRFTNDVFDPLISQNIIPLPDGERRLVLDQSSRLKSTICGLVDDFAMTLNLKEGFCGIEDREFVEEQLVMVIELSEEFKDNVRVKETHYSEGEGQFIVWK